MKTIAPQTTDTFLEEAALKFRKADHPVALTGAGISVASGIADFRSRGGLWSRFSPEEYATLQVFLDNPEKAWKLYRTLGRELQDKKPNKAHLVLAELEKQHLLEGIVTQNIDNLHQAAGSSNVLEIHGDHNHLHCLQCGDRIEVRADHFTKSNIPRCSLCDYPLKPNIVLFGEQVHNLDSIQELIRSCDLLLVIGTSAQVYPAATLPHTVKQQGGLVYEFNREQTLSTSGLLGHFPLSDYFFHGDLGTTLPLFGAAVLHLNS
ncbi:NAD-dependent deacylase [Desulfomarina profundi]|uniref:NAD-dependent deacylase n=1 Tax=Desulfomarina profundi TaxID=2772557 RepID=A0A8D5FJV8_9BACT|nr:NAD-dependent deacylase [Desulfomarina profundi]BCL59519.1 NAD-dependent deacylase [Desulfomarina profundi]